MKLKGKRARIAWYFPSGSGEGDRLGTPKLKPEVTHPSTDLRWQFLWSPPPTPMPFYNQKQSYLTKKAVPGSSSGTCNNSLLCWGVGQEKVVSLQAHNKAQISQKWVHFSRLSSLEEMGGHLSVVSGTGFSQGPVHRSESQGADTSFCSKGKKTEAPQGAARSFT